MKIKLKNQHKIIFDMFLNIVATAIPTVVLQLVILPLLSRDMSDSVYGLLVTILALLNVVPATMGNVLNNIRLLYQNEYAPKNYEGDFNVLLVLMSILNLIIVAIFTYSYERTITIISMVMILLVSITWLAKEYFIVAFRLKLNYVAIMINNLLQAAGYGFGYLIYHFTGYWQFIYLTGYVVSLIYIFARSSLWKEKLCITPSFRHTTWQGTLLLVSNLLNRMITYADRLLIYPILGGGIVSIYYAATVFGKVVSLVITPVNSVMLTYLSKVRKKQNSMFNITFLLGLGVGVVGYFVCIAISRPVLTLLYPQYVDAAMQYIWVTTGTMILNVLITIVNPFILKFFDMKWQIAINGGTVAVYIVLCMVLLNFFGLMGFCIGALLTNFLKLIFMLFIYHKCRTLEEIAGTNRIQLK